MLRPGTSNGTGMMAKSGADLASGSQTSAATGTTTGGIGAAITAIRLTSDRSDDSEQLRGGVSERCAQR
jgi:hypothetical protein